MNYNYKALDQNGTPIDGTIDASAIDQAILLLHQKELLVLELQPVDRGLLKSDIFVFLNRPSKKDVIIFTRQLATLIDASTPLLEAISILERQTENEGFRKIIGSVIASVEGGGSLSHSLSEHDKVFDSFYVNLIKVGEVSGKLQETLLYLADYLEHSAALSSKIRGAVFYPVFVLISMVVVATIMMTTVIPQLLTIIRDAGVTDLPLPTRMLIGTTNFFTNYVLYLLAAIVLGGISFYYYVRTDAGRLMLDRAKLFLPRFGKIFRNFYLARIAETLSTLVRSGVPIIESIGVTGNVIGNEVYRRILVGAQSSIQAGGSLSKALEPHKEFPKLVISMLSTGERTGRTESMLANILKFYKTEAEQDVQNLTQIIEPLLILILGVGIGLLVAAILLPIYSLINI